MINSFKNMLVALMAAGIYYKYILETATDIQKIYGMAVVVGGTLAFMGMLDSIVAVRERSKRKIVLKNTGFENYKKWLAGKVEEKRSRGKDKDNLKKFIMSVIMHQTKYAFTGEQIKELVALAEEEIVKCKQCEISLPKSDALCTAEGVLCESCMEV